MKDKDKAGYFETTLLYYPEKRFHIQLGEHDRFLSHLYENRTYQVKVSVLNQKWYNTARFRTCVQFN